MIDIQRFADNHRLKTRFDDDLTKIIPGKLGNLFEYDGELLGVMVMPNPPRRNYWGYVRASLIEAGFQVVQDGDGEGSATFNPANAKQVRLAVSAAGIKRRRILSPENREKALRALEGTRRTAGSGAGRAQS
ncbi:MAG TPA: hypothetical protein VII23_14030 [Terriglobales bacterium]